MVKGTGRLAASSGFTLVEALIAVMIIMILAGIGVPSYLKTVEKSKAIEATDAIQAIAVAEARYNSKYGTYCGAFNTPGFDYTLPPQFKFFNTPGLTGGTTWTVTFQRAAPGPVLYGQYTIKGTNQTGALAITCPGACQTDLIPLP